MRLLLITMLFGLGVCPANASEQFKQGEELYKEHCALCHGADGKQGNVYSTPIWGKGTQIQKFMTSKGLFEYIQLLMPFDDPTRLNDQQKWAIVQYMLANHGSLKPEDALDAGKAATIPIK